MDMDDKQHHSILQKSARRAMFQRGLLPDFSAEALVELGGIQEPAAINGEQVHDLSALLWVSIDNDDSRDLDRLTVAEAMPGDMKSTINERQFLSFYHFIGKRTLYFLCGNRAWTMGRMSRGRQKWRPLYV